MMSIRSTSTFHNGMILSILSLTSHDLIINLWSFPKLVDVELSSSNTSLRSNKVCLSLIEARLFFFFWSLSHFLLCLRGGSTPFLLEFFVRHLRIYQSIGTTKFRAWLWYHIRWTRLSPQWYDIVYFEHKLLCLCFGLPQNVSYQWR